MRMAYIYSLADPTTNEIRYVGKTLYPKTRLSGHKTPTDKGGTIKKEWIQSLINNNLSPIMEILDVLPEKESDYWELYWINQIKSWGFNLTNVFGLQNNQFIKHSDSPLVKKIKTLSLQKDISINELRIKIGWAKHRMNYFLSHKNIKLSNETLSKIASGLNVKVSDLLN